MLLRWLVATFLVAQSFGLQDQDVLQTQSHHQATAGGILRSEAFISKVNKALAEWHVPGIAIAIVDGDEIHAEVRSFFAD
jgi:hypothetical protein